MSSANSSSSSSSELNVNIDFYSLPQQLQQILSTVTITNSSPNNESVVNNYSLIPSLCSLSDGKIIQLYHVQSNELIPAFFLIDTNKNKFSPPKQPNSIQSENNNFCFLTILRKKQTFLTEEEKKSEGSSPTNPILSQIPKNGNNLRLFENGFLDDHGGRGPYATWMVQYNNNNNTFAFLNYFHINSVNKNGSLGFYLGFLKQFENNLFNMHNNYTNNWNIWKSQYFQPKLGNLNGNTQFYMLEVMNNQLLEQYDILSVSSVSTPIISSLSSLSSLFNFSPQLDIMSSIPPFNPIITPQQKTQFYEDGVLILRNFIPREYIDNSLRCINEHIGILKNNNNLNVGIKMEEEKKLSHHEDILKLFYHTQIYNLMENIYGKGNTKKIFGGQIALRYPISKQLSEQRKKMNLNKNNNNNNNNNNDGGELFHLNTKWHIDGETKLSQGEDYPFTILVGIVLSDQQTSECGNLRYWRKSHHLIKEFYKEAIESKTELDKKNIDFIINEQNGNTNNNNNNNIKMEEFKGVKGDVILLHQLVAHGIGINDSPNIRYQVYFRVSHQNHENMKKQLFNDINAEFEGLKNL